MDTDFKMFSVDLFFQQSSLTIQNGSEPFSGVDTLNVISDFNTMQLFRYFQWEKSQNSQKGLHIKYVIRNSMPISFENVESFLEELVYIRKRGDEMGVRILLKSDFSEEFLEFIDGPLFEYDKNYDLQTEESTE